MLKLFFSVLDNYSIYIDQIIEFSQEKFSGKNIED